MPAADRPTATVRDLASEALIIPESLPLPRVLEQMRQSHRQIAVVVDEYGGFAGVITFEDVAEEVVGEIWDEGDEQEETAEEQPDGSWEIPARLRLDEVRSTTGVQLPEHEDYDTVSGLIMERLGRMAEDGDTVDVAWEDRGEDGVPQVHHVQLDVLSTQRYVPDVVRVHSPTTHEGTLADEVADTEPEVIR